MCRSDVVGDLGTALLVGGWSTRMTLIGEHYGPVTGLAVEDLACPERWLLVEEHRLDGRLWLSDAPSPEQAMLRHAERPDHTDWHVAGVVDLDSGEVILLTKPVGGSTEDAREVAGVAAAVVELFHSGRDGLARTALSSLVDQVLPVDGLLSALAVLELGTEADADMVCAACARGVADGAAWEHDRESDEMLVGRVAARLEVVARSMAGEEALALLRSRLEDASRAKARAPIGPRYVATRLVTPRVSPERTAR